MMLTSSLAFADSADHLVQMLRSELEGRPLVVNISRDGAEARIRLESPGANTYDIWLSPRIARVPPSAPEIRTPRKNRHEAELRLPENWELERGEALGRIRQMLRADPYLHPMNTPAGTTPRATDLQRIAVAEIMSHQRSLVVYPPGMGKTVIAGLVAQELQKRGQNVLAVLIVQNRIILEDATPKLQSLMELEPGQVHRVYGKTSGSPLYLPGRRLISTSRTGAVRGIANLTARLRTFDGTVLWIMDEASALGKANGEFSKILSFVDQSIRPRDFFIGLSAVPWHTKTGPIHPIFHNHLVTAFADEAKRTTYLKSGKLMELARDELFSAMRAGYLTPLSSYREINYVENGRTIQDFLRDTDVETSHLSEPARRRVLKRDWQIHLPFVERMFNEFRRTEQRAGSQVTYWNRGVIFVPSIAHAEAYAAMFNSLNGRGRFRARAYHSNLESDRRDEALAWWDREGESHQYLFAIYTLGLGFDRPRLNQIGIAKRYSKEDRIGIQGLIQNLGRLTRVGSHKVRTSIIDFSGDMRRLLFDGLDEELVNSFFTEDGRREFARPARPLRFTDASTNLSRLDGSRFRAADVEIPLNPPSSRNFGEPWSVARLLLDQRVIPGLLPVDPADKDGRTRNLGFYVCQIINGKETDREPGFEAGIRLSYALGFDPVSVLESGLAKVIKKQCVRSSFVIPPVGAALEKTVIELEKTHPRLAKSSGIGLAHLIGEASALGQLEALVSQRRSFPTPRRWTLAEVLLHPLIPKLLNADAPNIAQLILGGQFMGLTEAGDWNRISWLDRLRTAHSYELLKVDEFSYLHDSSAALFATESLITVDPDLFGSKTDFTAHDLYRLASKRPTGDLTRRRAEGSLILESFDPGEVKSIGKRPPLDLARYQSTRTPNELDWHTPWTLARILVNPLASELSPVHATLVEGLLRSAPVVIRNVREAYSDSGRFAARIDRAETDALASIPKPLAEEYRARTWPQFSNQSVMDALVRATQARDRSVYEYLTSYLRGQGPVPARHSAKVNPETTGRWTVARLLLDPEAPKIFLPGTSGRTLGEVLCRTLVEHAHVTDDLTQAALAGVLAGLGLSTRNASFRAYVEVVSNACSDRAFGPIKAEGEVRISERDALHQLERNLLSRAPGLFGASTQITDADLESPDAPLFARTPLIPDLAPKATGHTVLKKLVAPRVPAKSVRPFAAGSRKPHPGR